MWYRVTSPNYDDFTHAAKVTITPRTVTLTSGSASKVYDGTALVNGSVEIGGDDFIGLEGATFDVTGSQTAVGTSANTFTYTLDEGTKAENYAITTTVGTLTVTQAALDPKTVFGGYDAGDGMLCERVYNGAAQPFEVEVNFDEPYTMLYALAADGAYSETPPTRRNVAEGDLTVFFRLVTANYGPCDGRGVLRIVAKELTDEMVVLTDEAFFFDPDSGQKTPSVTVADTNAVGVVISTTADYDISYGESTSAGAVPVTVTAKNNYRGEVTKTFDVLKRPVAPPVIGSKSYNGRRQTASVPADERWTVVANAGGIDVGEYAVTLRLVNAEDYQWKGLDGDAAEWTGVFAITRANNGWSQYPGIASWTSGETPSETIMGQARYGTVQVAYRRQGADVSTETAAKPSAPGKYVARFWVDATDNYIGVALTVPYEVAFEIFRGEGDVLDHTITTPVPVPYVWLDPYLGTFGDGDYEAAGHATGLNGCALWESYVAGLDPLDPASRFLAYIRMDADNQPVITWKPDLRDANPPRTYTILGKATLYDKEWTPVTDANKSQMRFFIVKVEIK